MEGGDDIYSPKINEEHIPMLYQLAKVRKIPMTRLVNDIIGSYLKKQPLLDKHEHEIVE